MHPHLLEETLHQLEENHIITRIWDRDPTVWGSPDGREIVDRLGWLTVADDMEPRVPEIQAFAREIWDAGFADVVLLGMGGSSLAPHVLAKTLAPNSGYPRFHMLDSTVPAAVLQCERALDLAHTLFIVASKSGSTIEMLSMFKYFWRQVSAITASPGRAFIAITDPGSGLERIACEHAFRAIFLNPTDIGGRYSALSLFGLVPAALAGVDIARLLQTARHMAARCSPAIPVRDNPGALLGAFLGATARQGRDKLALAISPMFSDLGLWIEQLIAESTGKHGTGVLPVILPPASQLTDEALRLADHMLVSITEGGETGGAPSHPAALARTLSDPHELGGEFYCWEMATAVAGHILGVNPFDQPNVAEAKRNTAGMLALYEQRGALEPADAITLDARTDTSAPAEALRRFFAEIRPGHYCAILGYLPPSDEWDTLFAEWQEQLALRLGVAITFGYGPRYLHSTGQLHKGGPATGHFLILTADDGEDVPVPGERYTFGVLKTAQALGDRQALEATGRPVLHFHLAGEARQTAHALRRVAQAAVE